VKPIIKDMCPGSCMAYTGPLSQKNSCLRCGMTRHDPITGRPRQQFWTILIRPIIQALKRNHQSTVEMDYLVERLEALLAGLQLKGFIDKFDDIACGSEILEAFRDGLINEGDTVLIMLLDGAQLYRNKVSDCWIYIWIITNLPPSLRHSRRHHFCKLSSLSITSYQIDQPTTSRWMSVIMPHTTAGFSLFSLLQMALAWYISMGWLGIRAGLATDYGARMVGRHKRGAAPTTWCCSNLWTMMLQDVTMTTSLRIMCGQLIKTDTSQISPMSVPPETNENMSFADARQESAGPAFLVDYPLARS
jgi:hypothetical protein